MISDKPFIDMSLEEKTAFRLAMALEDLPQTHEIILARHYSIKVMECLERYNRRQHEWLNNLET